MTDGLKQFLVLFLFFGVPGVAGAWIAFTKGRSVLLWMIIGCLLPPTLMVIIFQNPLREVNGHYRRCPECNEMQKWKFIACRYCGASMVPDQKGL
jgi:hypothetical protein